MAIPHLNCDVHVNDTYISFNVHGVLYVGDDGTYHSILFLSTSDGPSDIVAPIEREIRTFAIALTAVKDEQEYIVVRERTHRNTAESTNSRVKWWSILQALVLFSVVAWQVYYLKVRCFSSTTVGRYLILLQVIFRSKARNMIRLYTIIWLSIIIPCGRCTTTCIHLGLTRYQRRELTLLLYAEIDRRHSVWN